MSENLENKRKKSQLDDEMEEKVDRNEEMESSSEDNDAESDDNESNEEMEELEADFEAYQPFPEDKEGIKALLNQLFKKESIELGLLTDYLINDKQLTTVIKQLVDDQVQDDDEDVFSLSSLIQLNKKELINKPFIKLIKKFLIRTSNENNNKTIAKLIENEDENKFLILNERLINLPPKVGIISLQNLLDEARKDKNLKLNYFIIISKLLKAKDEQSIKKDNNKRSKQLDDDNIIYLNGEDEIFSNNALDKYEFKIMDDNNDLTVNQNWKSGQQYLPYRRVLLLDENGLNKSLDILLDELKK